MATYTKTCSNNSNYSLRLELTENSVSIENNTSVINYWLYLDSKYTRFENWNVTYTLNIGSEVSVNTTKSMSMPSARGEPLLLVSGSRLVTHNNDGTKSLSVSCSVSTATSQSYLPGSATISGETFVLTTIARKSIIGSVTERPGYPVTINVTRYSSSFTHTLSYTFGSMSGTIVSKSSDLQITWTPPITLYTQMIGLRYATGKVIVETFNGNTSLGTTEATLTLATSILYYPPNIDVLKYERGSGNSSSTWVANPNGSDIRVYYNATIISGIVGNTTNLVVKLDNTTKSSASDVTSGLKEHYIQNIGTVTTHQVSVNMSDTIGSSKTWNLTVTTVEVPFDINVNLPAIAFGKIAEKPKTVEFADDWVVYLGTKLLDFFYPVGRVYISTKNVSPQTFLGGKWEQIENVFLLAASTKYSAGSTGGEAEVILASSELPLHNQAVAEQGNTVYVYPSSRVNRATSSTGKYALLLNNTENAYVTEKQTNVGRLVAGDTLETRGQPHNNMPPYLAVYMWKRVA